MFIVWDLLRVSPKSIASTDNYSHSHTHSHSHRHTHCVQMDICNDKSTQIGKQNERWQRIHRHTHIEHGWTLKIAYLNCHHNTHHICFNTFHFSFLNNNKKKSEHKPHVIRNRKYFALFLRIVFALLFSFHLINIDSLMVVLL